MIEYILSKEHYVNAEYISRNPTAEPLSNYFYQKKVNCHDRQVHKTKPKKDKRKLNQAIYKLKGCIPYDKVECKINRNQEKEGGNFPT